MNSEQNPNEKIYKGYRILRQLQPNRLARNSMEYTVSEWTGKDFRQLADFPFRYLNEPETSAAYQAAERYIDSLPAPSNPVS